MVNAALVIVAVALACTDGSAALLAVTVIDFALDLAGAVNNPLAEMLPALADQVTAVLLVLLTTAANCTFPPATTDGSAGEICTLTVLTEGTIVTVYARDTVDPKDSPVTGYVRGAVDPRGSHVTVIVNVKVPAWVGTPEMLPVNGLRTRPGGNWP
jgi:hypothetical protein